MKMNIEIAHGIDLKNTHKISPVMKSHQKGVSSFSLFVLRHVSLVTFICWERVSRTLFMLCFRHDSSIHLGQLWYVTLPLAREMLSIIGLTYHYGFKGFYILNAVYKIWYVGLLALPWELSFVFYSPFFFVIPIYVHCPSYLYCVALILFSFNTNSCWQSDDPFSKLSVDILIVINNICAMTVLLL